MRRVLRSLRGRTGTGLARGRGWVACRLATPKHAKRSGMPPSQPLLPGSQVDTFRRTPRPTRPGRQPRQPPLRSGRGSGSESTGHVPIPSPAVGGRGTGIPSAPGERAPALRRPVGLGHPRRQVAPTLPPRIPARGQGAVDGGGRADRQRMHTVELEARVLRRARMIAVPANRAPMAAAPQGWQPDLPGRPAQSGRSSRRRSDEEHDDDYLLVHESVPDPIWRHSQATACQNRSGAHSEPVLPLRMGFW